MFFLRQKIEKSASCAWQSTSLRARHKKSILEENRVNLRTSLIMRKYLAVFISVNISWSVRVSDMMGSVFDQRKRIKTAMLRD